MDIDNLLQKITNVVQINDNKEISLQKTHTQKKIYDLTIKEIYLKIITTLVDIFEEVLQIKHITYEKTLHEIITILTIEDRMIYFGIFLIILSLFFFIIY